MRGFNPIATLRGILHEMRGAVRIAADARSILRLWADSFLFRVLQVLELPWKDRERTIRLKGGATITYRLNRGDIQSIREVWMDHEYALPPDVRPRVVVDLGANIGLTGVWLARRYGCTRLVAVEPSPSNARLAGINLRASGVEATVLEGAVGPTDGMARLEESAESNLNRLSDTGREVRLLSMESVLANLPSGTWVDLVKIDIEGAEEDLFAGDLRWLGRVGAIIIELHLSDEKCDALVARVESQGFRFMPLNAVFPGSFTMFLRNRAADPVT